MCKYVVSRSICMAQVGDVMGLGTKHNYIRPYKWSGDTSSHIPYVQNK